MVTGFSVERLDDEAHLQKISEDWCRLVTESDVDSLFVTWEWLSTWWRHFGSDGQLYTLCVRDADRNLIGLAPLRIVRRRFAGGAGLRVLEWLGSGSPVWSDALDLVSRRGSERDVAKAVGTYLLQQRSEWDAAVEVREGALGQLS